jgi:hypothetical protein
MGYGDRLLGVARSDAFEFRIESGTPQETASALKRFLNTRTFFYNRNKHHFSLVCAWEGGGFEEGVAADRGCLDLAARVRRVLASHSFQGSREDSRGGNAGSRVILTGSPVYRTEVLVEELDSAMRDNMARRLEGELSTAPVVVSTLGIRWRLALVADTPEEARATAEEIAVARRRDRGLLLNPNYQVYRFLGAEQMETGA